MTITNLALDHLQICLAALLRGLAAAVARHGDEVDAVARSLPPGASASITRHQVVRGLAACAAGLAPDHGWAVHAAMTEAEQVAQARLRAEAAARGVALPIDQLARAAALDRHEVEALLICAAAELDPRIALAVAYLQDDPGRTRPAAGFLAWLTASDLAERAARDLALGRRGRLRRFGLLCARGPGGEPASDADHELVLGPGVREALLGTGPVAVADPLELAPRPGPLPRGVEPARIVRLAEAMAGGGVSVLGVWGPRHAGHAEVVHALASALGVRLRRAPLDRADAAERARVVRETAADAAALGALLWIDTAALDAAEPGDAPGHAPGDALGDLLAASPARICLSGVTPLRPHRLLAARRYAELVLPAPDRIARGAAWAAALPELAPEQVADLAARYRFGADELAAIATTARTAADLASNGHPGRVADHVDAACAQVVRRRSHRFARVIAPRRGPDDLILHPEMHRQVLEIGRAYRAWPRIADAWRLDHIAAPGLKALFFGEPGTGKTLAAEVVAGQLGLPLVKIDLAQIVSKWLGETEKNLEAAFDEAEDGNCVLMFDEAEALFGKRGEVRHGTDRYANLEVAYLLQRLEAYDGLVILASNLRDQIDPAFRRRFHSIIHFARPTAAERQRLWRLALPSSHAVDPALDYATVARLDLTGAAIHSAARIAALFADEAGAERIGPAHVVHGILRQCQRESRLPSPDDFGAYAVHAGAR